MYVLWPDVLSLRLCSLTYQRPRFPVILRSVGFCSWQCIIQVAAASVCHEDSDCRNSLQGRVFQCLTPQAIFQNTSQRSPKNNRRKQVTTGLISWSRDEWKLRVFQPYPPPSLPSEKGSSRGLNSQHRSDLQASRNEGLQMLLVNVFLSVVPNISTLLCFSWTWEDSNDSSHGRRAVWVWSK